MKRLISAIAVAFSLIAARPAEAEEPVDNDLESRAIVFAANTGLGAALGCIGSEMSGDGCLEGLWKGSLGGAVTFAGMELGSYNARVPFTGLAGRQIVNLGSSMTSNAMFSRGLLQRYETDFGPVVFSLDNYEGFHAYIMPLATGVIFYNFTMGNRLNLIESLEDGTFVFNFDKLSFRGGMLYDGNTTSTIPAYLPGYPTARSHENIHTYQLSRVRWTDELVPQLDFIKYGAELSNLILIAPSNVIGGNAYHYAPLEIEASAMMRSAD